MSICTAPTYQLKKLNNLFIELTAKNCNQKCNGCYIDFPTGKNVKDFIHIDKIKQALNDTKNEELECIYLTGGEPMTHPDFNAILRLCLKRCNVCICTNSSFLNEKKIRFLKKVEDEGVNTLGVNTSGVNISGANAENDICLNTGNNQIFFRLSLAHYDEFESDKVKYRGHFRQTISALKILSRYNFTSVLSIQNFYKLSEIILKENFKRIFEQNNITNTDIQISVSYPDYAEEDMLTPSQRTDCMNGRILTKNGVYACPFLANDYRGRMGASFQNYSKTIIAETDFCATCSSNNNWMFTIG